MGNLTDIGKAVYYCDVERLKSLITDDFDPYIFKDLTIWGEEDNYCLEELHDCPIYYMSMCLKEILKYDWPALDVSHLKEMKQRNLQVLDFWKSLGFDVDGQIDFRKFPDIIGFKDSEGDALYLDSKTVDLNGWVTDECRLIDLELFVAAQMLQYDKVERLMKSGANPEVWVETDGGHQILDLVHDRCGCVSGWEDIYHDYWHYIHDGSTDHTGGMLYPIMNVLRFTAWDKMETLLTKEY